MDAEFFIHGPRNAFYGKQEENRYCLLFDNSQIKDEIRFVVDIRNGIDNKRYTYYTYCRYSNIIDIDGRSGAYIGLTIRMDVYYSNLRNLFTVLDAAFNSKVVGLLVKKFGEGYQYLVSDFRNSKQSIASNVERCVGTMLMGIISQDEIYPIDSTFNTGGYEIVKGLDDNKFKEARLEDIRKGRKLVFSSSKDIELVERLKSDFEKQNRILLAEKETEIAQRDSQIESLETEKSMLEGDAAKKEEEISALKHQLSSLSSRLDSFKKPHNEFSPSQKEDCLPSERHRQEEIIKEKKERQRLSDDEKHPKRENSPITPHTSDGNSDGDNTYGKIEYRLRRLIDYLKSWGEGLKGGITAFFLVAISSCALLTIKHFAFDKKAGKPSEIHKEESLDNNSNERLKCLVLPNDLTKRIYKGCTSSEKLCKKLEVSRSNDISSSVCQFILDEPEVNIQSFTWTITNPAGQKFSKEANSTTIEYTIKEKGTYIV